MINGSSSCTFTVLKRRPAAVRIKIESIDNFERTSIFQRTPDKYLKAIEIWVPISVIRNVWGELIFEGLKGKESIGGPWEGEIWDKILFNNIERMVQKRINAERKYCTPGDEVNEL